MAYAMGTDGMQSIDSHRLEPTAPAADGVVLEQAGNPNAGVNLCGVLALGAWAWAVISTIVQKTRADSLIRDSWDISAVQIQQLNGQVTAHAALALLVGLAGTVPLHIAAALRRKP